MFSPWLVPTLAHRSWMKLLLFLVLYETFTFPCLGWNFSCSLSWMKLFSSSSIKLFYPRLVWIFSFSLPWMRLFFPRLEWSFCFPSLDLIFLFCFWISFSLSLTKLFFTLSVMIFFSFYSFFLVGFHRSSMKICVHGSAIPFPCYSKLYFPSLLFSNVLYKTLFSLAFSFQTLITLSFSWNSLWSCMCWPIITPILNCTVDD